MKKAAYQEPLKTRNYVIVVDEDVAAYIEQQGITDPNTYMTKLLQDEVNRQHGKVGKPAR